MINITTAGVEAPAVERETLLRLDGVEYTIPKKFLPTTMLEYLHYVGVAGGDAAGKWALHFALGDDGFWALVNAGAAITAGHLRAMIDCVTGRMLGIETTIPGPKGKPDPTPGPGPETDFPGPGPETDFTEEPPDDAVWPDATSAPIGQ